MVRRTPTVLQLEAAECGAASLAMVLASHGRFVPLETLRRDCGVSRDGSKASSLLKAARAYGLEAKGLKAEPGHLAGLSMPAIAFVDFCHFLVVEGVSGDTVFLNDPASGRRRVSMQEFDAMFTGVILTFARGEGFEAMDERPSLSAALARRTVGVREGVFFVLLAGLALVLPGLAVPILSRVFVDFVLVRNLEDWLPPLVLGLLLAAALRFLLAELRDWTLARAETRLAVDGASEMFRHVLRLPIPFFGVRYAGEIATRLHLSDGIAGLLTNDAARLLLNLIAAVFFLMLMIAYDPLVALAATVFGLLNVVAVVAATRAVSDARRKISIDGGKLAGVELSGLQDIETYKAAGAEDAFFARWAGLHANMVSAEQEIGRKLALLRATPGLLTALTSAAVLGIGGWQVMAGEITLGALVALQTLAASFTAPIIELTAVGAKLQEIRSFTERADDLLRQPTDPMAVDDGAPIDSLPEGRIDLIDVSFGHLPLEPPLIAHLNLSAPPGGSVAIVGASGSGKSTLGRLLAGLYTPSAGRILIDGRPLEDWPKAALAGAVAYIDQDVALFEGTIRENLSLWDETLPERQIVEAAHDAAIHDVIAQRPGGYDAFVEEGGRNFSGGQRQRLEIARALAGNPRIIIMDEATSALDAATEAEIVENILKRGATLVVIAHRLSTIRDADEILTLDRGTVIERGGHADLLSAKGAYAALIEA